MHRSLQEKIGSVLERRNPDGFSVAESFACDEADDVSKYVRLAMEAVDEEATKKSKDAAANVKDLLARNMSNVSFQYQGSIMTDTHIKGASDVDLLILPEQFFGWDKSGVENSLQIPECKKYSSVQLNRLEDALKTVPYKGDPLGDLRYLRDVCEGVLSKAYDECDLSKAKSIKIFNKHYNRKVDIVVASWFDDATSFANNRELTYRGIQLYNCVSNTRESIDRPFLSAKLINERSSCTGGRLKKMIRLLKTLKAESEKEIFFSSFDIYAICYAMNPSQYANLSYIDLVPALARHFLAVLSSDMSMNGLRSVDGAEMIFKTTEKKDAAGELAEELFTLIEMLKTGGLL